MYQLVPFPSCFLLSPVQKLTVKADLHVAWEDGDTGAVLALHEKRYGFT